MTSGDLLVFIATISIIVLTVLASIALAHGIAILGRIHTLLDRCDELWSSVPRTLHAFTDRVLTLKNTIELIAQGLKAASHVASRRAPRNKKAKTIGATNERDEDE